MVSGPDVAANLAQAAHLAAAAARAGARFIVLPENFALMPHREEDRLAVAEKEGAGPLQEFLSREARSHRVWLVGGTIPLAAKTPGKVRAACLLFDDRGERVARYDKRHLFDATLPHGEQYRESRSVEAGERVVVAETPLGRLGLAVCYDLRFPELFRRMAEEGAELFAVPSAFTAPTGAAHWEVLVRARAIENLAYVIAAGQGGTHANGRRTHGDSMIVGPWGEVLDRLPQGSGHVLAECDRRELERCRASLPGIAPKKLSA
jgi:nitrilase